MPIRACAECQRLWQEFVSATMIEIRIRNRRALADKGLVVALPGALEHTERVAAESCDRARRLIREHEERH
jgi:hypothetical protein